MLALAGILTGTRGACPVCGKEVDRLHAFNGVRLLERYGCYRCGTTEYAVHVAA